MKTSKPNNPYYGKLSRSLVVELIGCIEGSWREFSDSEYKSVTEALKFVEFSITNKHLCLGDDAKNQERFSAQLQALQKAYDLVGIKQYKDLLEEIISNSKEAYTRTIGSTPLTVIKGGGNKSKFVNQFLKVA
ncbi:hypothetical protein DRO66_00255 [Candidatus Bathyarchaeota archaeon]|nr:MAG: hypothetical protein DRO66_00255 [Candidatus Bathyarchaeota archaeon]